MQKFTIGKNEAGQRLDKFLVKYMPSAPKSLLYKMLRKKNITLNSKKATGDEMLAVNDTVESFFSDETFAKFTENAKNSSVSAAESKSDSAPKSSKLAKQNIAITQSDIVYEDDDILIVDKKPGILSQKADNNDYSLNEWLIDYMLEKGSITEKELNTFHPSICNRLDRNTGGLVICGKSLLGLQTMTELIRDKDIEKHYITICHGAFTHTGRIEAYISKDDKKNKSTIKNTKKFEDKSKNAPVKPASKSADSTKIITEFNILKKYKNATLLDVNLLTGKSHQIRAQLASFGNPILGDIKYGSTSKDLKYQLLYAYKLIFPPEEMLPEQMKHLANKTIELEMPKYFVNAIDKL